MNDEATPPGTAFCLQGSCKTIGAAKTGKELGPTWGENHFGWGSRGKLGSSSHVKKKDPPKDFRQFVGANGELFTRGKGNMGHQVAQSCKVPWNKNHHAKPAVAKERTGRKLATYTIKKPVRTPKSAGKIAMREEPRKIAVRDKAKARKSLKLRCAAQ